VLSCGRSPDFLIHLGTTSLRAVAGLAIATAIGLVVAIAAARYAVLRRMLEPAVGMLRVLPPPAIVPISIFVLGIGTQLFLFIIAFAAIWPIYINAANSLAAGEPVQLMTGRCFGYSRWEILLRLRLPAALPEIVTGIRKPRQSTRGGCRVITPGSVSAPESRSSQPSPPRCWPVRAVSVSCSTMPHSRYAPPTCSRSWA